MAAPMMSVNKLTQLTPFLRLLLQQNVAKTVNIRPYSNDNRYNNDDFFGIPEDYKLEHFRHSVPTKTKDNHDDNVNVTTAVVGADVRNSLSKPKIKRSTTHQMSILKENIESNLVEDYHMTKSSRRERRIKRAKQMKDYITNFGVVSISTKMTEDSTQIPSAHHHHRYHRNSHNPSNIFQVVSNPMKPLNSTDGVKSVNNDNTTAFHRNGEGRDSETRDQNNASNYDFDYVDSQYFQSSLSGSSSQSIPPVSLIKNSHSSIGTDISELPMENSTTSEKENEHMKTLVKHNDEMNFFDEYYFPDRPYEDTSRDSSNMTIDLDNPPTFNKNIPSKGIKQHDDKINLFDEYYFPEMTSEHKSVVETDRNNNLDIIDDQNFGKIDELQVLSKNMSVPKESDFNAIDEQYFGKQDSSYPGSSVFSDLVSAYDINKDDSQSTPDSRLMAELPFTKSEEFSSQESSANSVIVTNRKTLFKKKRPEAKINDDLQPTSAFDLAMKIREDMKISSEASVEKNLTYSAEPSGPLLNDGVTRIKAGRVDSKGFRILSDQVLDFDKIPSMDVVDILKKSIVFDHEDFLVIDKPHGLPSVGQLNDTFSLSSLLPLLGRALPRKYKASDLHLVQGLDRDVSGNVLLAKNPEVAYILKAMFKDNEVVQRFWAITKGVPSPSKGIIDIPIGVGRVGNIFKKVLRPHFPKQEDQWNRKTGKASSELAVTEYSVLSSHLQSALVECRLHTCGVKHQVRVHLSSGLNTPILGDHKYSHFSKLAPQKLDRSTLELLGVRQAKVRHISLNLHCRSLVLPDYKSQTFVITSHLPSFFSKNMKRLKLYLPKK